MDNTPIITIWVCIFVSMIATGVAVFWINEVYRKFNNKEDRKPRIKALCKVLIPTMLLIVVAWSVIIFTVIHKNNVANTNEVDAISGAATDNTEKVVVYSEKSQSTTDSQIVKDSDIDRGDWGVLIPNTSYIILINDDGTMEGFYTSNTGISQDYFDMNSIWFIDDDSNKKEWVGKFKYSYTPFKESEISEFSDEEKREIVEKTLIYMNVTYKYYTELYNKCIEKGLTEDKEFILPKINSLATQYNSYVTIECSTYTDIITYEIPEKLDIIK